MDKGWWKLDVEIIPHDLLCRNRFYTIALKQLQPPFMGRVEYFFPDLHWENSCTVLGVYFYVCNLLMILINLDNTLFNHFLKVYVVKAKDSVYTVSQC